MALENWLIIISKRRSKSFARMNSYQQASVTPHKRMPLQFNNSSSNLIHGTMGCQGQGYYYPTLVGAAARPTYTTSSMSPPFGGDTYYESPPPPYQAQTSLTKPNGRLAVFRTSDGQTLEMGQRTIGSATWTPPPLPRQWQGPSPRVVMTTCPGSPPVPPSRVPVPPMPPPAFTSTTWEPRQVSSGGYLRSSSVQQRRPFNDLGELTPVTIKGGIPRRVVDAAPTRMPSMPARYNNLGGEQSSNTNYFSSQEAFIKGNDDRPILAPLIDRAGQELQRLNSQMKESLNKSKDRMRDTVKDQLQRGGSFVKEQFERQGSQIRERLSNTSNQLRESFELKAAEARDKLRNRKDEIIQRAQSKIREAVAESQQNLKRLASKLDPTSHCTKLSSTEDDPLDELLLSSGSSLSVT